MAISRKPKNTDNQEHDEPVFGAPTAQVFDDVDNEDGRQKTENEADRFEKMAQQIADIQRDLKEQNQNNMALLSPAPWKDQVEQITEVRPESIALPDPALDPNGFEAATAERLRIRMQNEQNRKDRETRKAQDFKSKVDQLWSDFNNDYPELSGDEEKLSFAAGAVATAAKKRGVDVERYMFVTRDKYLSDVAKKYRATFGENEVDEDIEEDVAPRRRTAAANPSRNNPRRRNRSEDDDEASRTGGIFGGNESGGRAARNRDNDEAGAGSMIDDIHAMQKKSGFW